MKSERYASFRQLVGLLPEIDALEGLRIALARHAVPHPDHIWSDSARVATVDSRVLDAAAVRAAVAEAAEEEQHDSQEIFDAVCNVLLADVEGDRHAAVSRLVRAGEDRESRGRYAASLRFYRAAGEAAGPLADRASLVLALRRIGRVQLVRGELAEAETSYRMSLDQAILQDLRKDEVIARTGLGNLCARGGRWSEAEEIYAAAVARTDDTEAAEFTLERAQLMTNLAHVVAKQNRLGEAREWLDKAAGLWAQIDSSADEAVWSSAHGAILWAEGDIKEAQRVYEEAINSNPPLVYRASYEIDLANMLAETGRLNAAWEWGRAAETSALSASAVGYVAHVYRGLGNVARESGSEAVAFYEKSLEIARRYRLRLDEAKTLIQYARLRGRDGNREEAEAYLHEALAICASLGALEEGRAASEELERLRSEEAPPEVGMPA